MKQKIIAQGAEALLIRQNEKLIKRRVPKGYRHPEIDRKIRIQRTRREAKLLEKAGKIISTPRVISVNEKHAEIDMEFIDGKKLSESLDNFSLKEQIEICNKIGQETAGLHNNDLIHGDLTTSNMIYKDQKNADAFLGCSKITDFRHNQIYFIDFGLGFHSSRIEDKAVDLHLLRQALESKHFMHWQELFDSVLSGYKEKSNDGEKILQQFKKVESRGRYKSH